MDMQEKKQHFVAQAAKRLSANFDLTYNEEIEQQVFDLVGRYQQELGRLFITKKDIIDRYEIFEQCYLKCFDIISENDIDEYFDFLSRLVNSLNPGQDHFQTDVTGIMVCSGAPDKIQKHLSSKKFERVYRLYFRGWSEVRLVCADLSTGRVYTNKAGRELKKVYQGCTVVK